MGMVLLFVYPPFILLLIIGYAVLGWKIPTASMTLGAFASLVQIQTSQHSFLEEFTAIACFPLYAGAPILIALAWKVLRKVWVLFTALDEKFTIGK